VTPASLARAETAAVPSLRPLPPLAKQRLGYKLQLGGVWRRLPGGG